VAFAIGSYIGSYVGCIIEEKLAMGSNMLICIASIDEITLIHKLRELNFEVTSLEGKNSEDDKNILFIMTSRKRKKIAINAIQRIDKTATIIIENAYTYNK
jgi:Uncharacterized protein conserved in bacteria